MAITSERITGHQVTVTFNGGTQLKWREITLRFVEDEEDAQASDEGEKASVQTAVGIEGTLSGFLGAVNNGATIPQIGDDLSDFDVEIGADSVLPALNRFTNIKAVGPIEFNLVKGPATYSVPFKSGRLNNIVLPAPGGGGDG